MKISAASVRWSSVLLVGFLVVPWVSAGGLREFLFGGNDLQTITVTDMTPAGNLLRQPTPSQPLYFAAISAGYHDFGGIKAGEKPISRQLVDRTMLKILAKQGYLPAGPNQRPDVVLAWRWGTLNVETFETGSGFAFTRINEPQMLRFLGGEKLGLISAHGNPFPELTLQPGLFFCTGDARNLMDTTRCDLYVAVISAYAVERSESGRAVLLWNTRVSSPARGFWLPDALPAMLAIATPYIGRETARPVWIRATDKFKPDVQLGDLKVLD